MKKIILSAFLVGIFGFTSFAAIDPKDNNNSNTLTQPEEALLVEMQEYYEATFEGAEKLFTENIDEVVLFDQDGNIVEEKNIENGIFSELELPQNATFLLKVGDAKFFIESVPLSIPADMHRI